MNQNIPTHCYKLFFRATALVLLAACGNERGSSPTAPTAPNLANGTCQLEMSDQDARTAITALMATVTALEASGALTSGQATALNGHLQKALDAIDQGDYCSVSNYLRIFRGQVDNFVAAGVLTPTQGGSLGDSVSDVLEVFQLAFVSSRSGNAEIYLMDVTSTPGTPTNLTMNLARDVGPVTWSADGSKMAFVSERDGNQEIYVMNADGTGVTNVSNHAARDESPTMSPDGSKVLFVSRRNSGVDIYVVDANGTNLTNLTNSPTIGEDWPEWSPDGTAIAFNRGGLAAVMSATGSDVRTLTSDGWAEEFAWSPDSKRFAFAKTPPTSAAPGEIYVVNINGTGLTNLSNHSADDEQPQWSPTGDRIVFLSTRDGNNELYVVNANGTGLRNLSNTAAGEGLTGAQIGFSAVWSPDGRKIAFHTNRTGNWEVFIMDADGSNPRNLTSHSADDFVLGWRPR